MIVVVAAIAALGFTLAGLAGLLGVSIGRPIHAVAVGVASGILLAISLGELFPEALEVAGHERAVVGFLVGFVVLFLVEVATRGHTHHDESDAASHVDVHAHAVWPFILGLALHNLTDGFAIGTSDELSHEAASAVALGVLIHQLPVGISFAAVLAAAHASRRFVAQSAVALGGLIVLGAVVATALPAMSEASLATIGAAAAGALAYIGAGHLLPEAHRERASAVVAVAFPRALAVTTYLFVFVLHHE